MAAAFQQEGNIKAVPVEMNQYPVLSQKGEECMKQPFLGIAGVVINGLLFLSKMHAAFVHYHGFHVTIAVFLWIVKLK